MTSMIKLAAIAVIAAGGTLAGVIGGWNFGPLTLQLGPEELAMVGGACGIFLAVVGCCLASEYADARARNQVYLTVLRRLAGVIGCRRRKEFSRSAGDHFLKLAPNTREVTL